MITMTERDNLTQLLRNMQGQLDSLDKKQDKQSDKLDKQDDKLNEIHDQTVRTNSRVNEHDSQLKRIWAKLKSLTDTSGKTSLTDKLDTRFFLIMAIILLILVVAGVGFEAVRQVQELIR